jgi:hypothetical protein
MLVKPGTTLRHFQLTLLGIFWYYVYLTNFTAVWFYRLFKILRLNTTPCPLVTFSQPYLGKRSDNATSGSLLSTVSSESVGLVTNILDFSLSPLCKWDLHSSGMLGSEDLWLFTDVSGPPIGPIFKGQADQERNCLTFTYWYLLTVYRSLLQRSGTPRRDCLTLLDL